MTQEINPETYFERLQEMAVSRFGEERANVLVPAIREIAECLAAVARFSLRGDEEPAFFL